MTIKPSYIILASMLLSLSTWGPTLSVQTLDTAAISSALGRTGKLMPGDVYRLGLPRTDLHVAIDGLTLRPGFALAGYAVYKAEPQGTLVLGDIPVLPPRSMPCRAVSRAAAFTSRRSTIIGSTRTARDVCALYACR